LLPDISDPLLKQFLFSSGEPAGDEVLACECHSVPQTVFADVFQAGEGRSFGRRYRVAEDHHVHTEILDQSRQEARVLTLQARGVRIEDDGPVQRVALAIDQVVAIQRLLIETEDVERQHPCLEQTCDRLELASSLDQDARRILPLIGNDQEESIGQWRTFRGGLGGEREAKDCKHETRSQAAHRGKEPVHP
jgi:hypothetical protein